MSEIERVQFKLMLPVHMKEALEEAAHDNRRSLSAEIIQRLYTTLEMDEYQPDENANPDEITMSLSEFYNRIDAVVERTIRMVREEERKAGLEPLPMDEQIDAIASNQHTKKRGK